MVLFTRITFNGSYFDNTGTNMAAAFGPGGVSDCRDIAGWQTGNPGFWYFYIVGNVNGEEISFKIYDEASDQIYDCDQTIIFQDGDTIGSPADPYWLSVGSNLITGTINLLTTTPPVGDLQNAEVSNGTYSVHPNSSGYYELPVVPGTYNITASLSGYNSVTQTDVEVFSGQNTENIDFTLIDWEPLSGTQYSMAVMCEVMFGSNPVIYDGFNHIGAFGPGGEDDCRGVAVWQEPNPPYWDGYWFLTIVGNIQNEEINFKVYESSTSAIYDCWESVTFDNNSTLGTPDNPLTLNIDFSINQVLDLGDNWNWISFYVHPLDPSIASVFGSLGANIYQIKNQSQSATYFEASQSWIGNLTEVTDGEAYLVYMVNPVNDFTVNGEPIDVYTPINLTAGWNWIAYYPRTITSLEEALHVIEQNAIQVKSQSQIANYINPPGTWVGDLVQMEPNQGYKLNMNASDILVYGGSELITKKPKPEPTNSDEIPDWTIIPGTQYSMVMMAEITLDGLEFDNSGNNMAGAFGPGGETDCRSIGMWQPANPPYYDTGFWYFTIVGDLEGEDISFKIYDEASDDIFSCNETITFLNNETYGSPTDPYVLNAYCTSSNEIITPSAIDIKVFPNPFNPSTTISFNINSKQNEQLELGIYNLKGQQVSDLTRNLSGLNSNEPFIGQRTINVTWNGTDNNNQPVASGVYFIKLSSGNANFSRKVLLLK
jgi:hypothetical protein